MHVISVSRPKTVMNHGMPAAAAFRGRRPDAPRIRSDARSLTDWPKERPRSSHSARSCGTRSCHAASESRTRPRSSPKRRSTARGTSSSPSATGTTSMRTSQCSRGPSEMSYEIVEPFTVPRCERMICVRSESPGSANTNWLCSSSKRHGAGSGSGSACSGSPSAKSCALTERMSAKSDSNASPSWSVKGFMLWFSSTTTSCIPSPTKRSRRTESWSCCRLPDSGLRRKNAAEKYSTFPDDSGSGVLPLIVSASFERKRVSSAKSPLVSPPTSPSSSQMQNVDPSRIVSTIHARFVRPTTARAP